MEGNGSRRLGWIAIALGSLALVVALSGRMQPHSGRYNGPYGHSGPPAYQAGPEMHGQAGPKAPFDQRGQFGPRDQAGPHGQFGAQGQFEARKHWGAGPHRGLRFWFFPFMLIGGLLRIAFVVLLVWLGLRLIRGGGPRGPWGRGPGGQGPWGREPGEPGKPGEPSEQDPPSRTDPEQPPYTGETRQI